MKYFYIGKEQALRNESLVYSVSDYKIKDYKDIFGENCVEYIGDSLPHYLTIEKDGVVREAKDIELYERGVYSLNSNEFIKDNKIYNAYDFPIPETIVRPFFNNDRLMWEESATLDEIVSFWKEKCKILSLDIMILERIGLNGDFEYISTKTKLDKCKEMYMLATHELALEINKTL